MTAAKASDDIEDGVPADMSEAEIEKRYTELGDKLLVPKLAALIQPIADKLAAVDAKLGDLTRDTRIALLEKQLAEAKGGKPKPEKKLDAEGNPLDPIDPAVAADDDDAAPMTRAEFRKHLADQELAKKKSRTKTWL